MSQQQSIEAIEAEAAAVRAELATASQDIRLRASPAALIHTAQDSLKRRVGVLPSQLSEQTRPLALVVAGGAIGVLGTSLISKRRLQKRLPSQGAASVEGNLDAPRVRSSTPRLKLEARAILLSTLGVVAGYLAGLLVPETTTEDRLLAQPKAVLRGKVDEFLHAHLRGMQQATLNLFGASRLSAAALIGVGLFAQVLQPPTSAAAEKKLWR